MKTKASPLVYAFAAGILTPSFVAGLVVFVLLFVVIALALFILVAPTIPFVVYKLRKGNKNFGTFPTTGTPPETVPES